MKLSFVIIFLLLTCFTDLTSQNINREKNKQELQLAAYNVGFGILTSSIGAVINKPKNVSVWQSIKKSAWQGAVGGSLQYVGKKLTYQINKNENYWWGWPSKLVHSAGVSICQNAAMGNNFGKYWVLDYGPARINLFVDKGSVNAQPQFNLLFAYDLYFGLSIGKVDWGKSLQTGTFTFSSNTALFTGGRVDAIGVAYTRSINYASLYEGNTYRTITHEIVHTYQSDQYRVFNVYFNPLKAKINNKGVNKVLNYIYVELPYFYGLYATQFNKTNYYRNFYEFEVEFFATNKYVNR